VIKILEFKVNPLSEKNGVRTKVTATFVLRILQPLWKQLKNATAIIRVAVEFLKQHFGVAVEILKRHFGVAAEFLKRHFGEAVEFLRRQNFWFDPNPNYKLTLTPIRNWP